MINIFLFSFLSSIYLLCAGIIFVKKDKKSLKEIYLSIFLGAIILSFIAIIANFFISLNQTFNSIILILVLTFGTIFIFKKKIFYQSIYVGILISLISTLILTFDTIYRPDSSMYHLPYTKIINDNKIIFGISNIHFRFGHTSILQYLNAIFNNYIFNFKGIIIPAAIIFSSMILYFYNEISKNFDKDKIYSYSIFLILAFILYGYNRYSEFGNDTLAHLYFLLICSFLIKKDFQEKLNLKTFSIISLLSLFCFMLKSSLILIFLIPFYLCFYNFNKRYFINILNLFTLTFALAWFTKNLIVSGCLIYPIEITCFEQLKWFTNDINFVTSAKIQSLDNQAWSKGWSNYIGPKITQELFVKDFFWVKTWLSVHGVFVLKKLSIFLVLLLILHILLTNIDRKKFLAKEKIKKEILFLFFLSIIGVLIWFLRFPIFRYGSSYIVLFIVILAAIFSIKNLIEKKNTIKFKKFINNCIIIFFMLFVLKHINRISQNFDIKAINDPWPKFHLQDQNNLNFKSDPIIINGLIGYYLLKSNDGCGYTASPCSPYKAEKVNIIIKNGYKMYYIEN